VFGNGETTYIVLFTTRGAASSPRSLAIENVHATVRFLTLFALIAFSALNRVDW